MVEDKPATGRMQAKARTLLAQWNLIYSFEPIPSVAPVTVPVAVPTTITIEATKSKA